jgi:hypothetical protein
VTPTTLLDANALIALTLNNSLLATFDQALAQAVPQHVMLIPRI